MIVQVEKFMRKWNMVPEGGRVLVGVSGGADSVCLCLILYELSTKMNFHLRLSTWSMEFVEKRVKMMRCL